MGKFEESNYYKSKEHLENLKNAGIKGRIKIQELKEKKIKEYYNDPITCKNCGNPISYDKKSWSVFCNHSCAAKYNNKERPPMSEEQKLKISLTILNGRIKKEKFKKEKIVLNDVIRICLNCGKDFIVKRIKRKLSSQKYCCKECANIGMKINVSKTQKERVKNGTHRGWTSRNIQSYPEKFFTKVLNDNNIKYEPNFTINKRDLGLNDISNYFLDFYIKDKKLDLEIDGKQHTYKDRKEKDEIRDELLEKNGIKVYRIKWKNPINDINKKYIKKEIEKFIKYYNWRCIDLVS